MRTTRFITWEVLGSTVALVFMDQRPSKRPSRYQRGTVTSMLNCESYAELHCSMLLHRDAACAGMPADAYARQKLNQEALTQAIS